MKKTLFAAALLLTYSLMGSENLKEYKFVRNAVSSGTRSETLAIRFDNALYKNTNDEYSNILITDRDGKAVPFAVCDVEEPGGGHYSGKISGFKRDVKQNRAEIELTLPEARSFNTINFSTSLRRFDKKVTVTFFDGKDNIIRKDDGLKLFKYDDLYGSSAVKFERIFAKKVHIVIHNFVEKKELPVTTESSSSQKGASVIKSVRNEEFKIKNITVKDDTERKPRLVPVVLPEVRRSHCNGKTVIVFNSSRIPLKELKVSATDKYYSRIIMLEFMDSKGNSIYAVGTDIYPKREEITLPGDRADRVRVTIEDGDDAPLRDLVFHWKAPEKILLAAAQNGSELKIYYGGYAKKKNYDIEKYADKLLLDPHDFYSLGKEELSTAYDPGVPVEKIMNYVMWIVLAAVILLLGAVIIKLLRSAPQAEKEE